MGRLFWKFFISIWLAQLLSIIGIGGAFWLKERSSERMANAVETGPPASILLDASEVTLRVAGPDGLRALLGQIKRETIYAVHANGKELLGREVNRQMLKQVRELHAGNPKMGALRAVTIAGDQWLLFVARQAPPPGTGLIGSTGPGAPPKGPPPRLRFMPEIFALVGSIAAAAALAWYFAMPIRHLRSAFDAVATGNLDTRVTPAIGKRRDELADLARDFDGMAERLQDLVEGQRRLLHDVSHELRSPLARLEAAVGLARQNPEKTDSSLVRIERESGRMNVMIGELLTLSRLEAGVGMAMDEAVALEDLLGTVVDDARFEANAVGKNVVLKVGEAQAVRGNPELLQSAIENIVRNAVRYTAEHTTVEVTLRRCGQSGFTRIAVRDHGEGVAEDELDAIFRPFVRGRNSERQNGHGLGLAIADRMIRAHGGTVSANNVVGGGLEVVIDLPCNS